MRRLYTTTEYLFKISNKEQLENNPIQVGGGCFDIFNHRAEAEYDANWLKKKFPARAREVGGPKVVEVKFTVLKEKKKR